MKSKKWFVLTFVLALVLTVFAGCAKKEAVSSSATTTSVATMAATTAPTTAPTATPEAKPAGLTGDFEIQYFVGGYGDKWWKKVIADFQALNPGLKIKEDAGPEINKQTKPLWISCILTVLIYSTNKW
jgi:N-acetylglucosamine transport system substrate-binding protein